MPRNQSGNRRYRQLGVDERESNRYQPYSHSRSSNHRSNEESSYRRAQDECENTRHGVARHPRFFSRNDNYTHSASNRSLKQRRNAVASNELAELRSFRDLYDRSSSFRHRSTPSPNMSRRLSDGRSNERSSSRDSRHPSIESPLRRRDLSTTRSERCSPRSPRHTVTTSTYTRRDLPSRSRHVSFIQNPRTRDIGSEEREIESWDFKRRGAN